MEIQLGRAMRALNKQVPLYKIKNTVIGICYILFPSLSSYVEDVEEMDYIDDMKDWFCESFKDDLEPNDFFMQPKIQILLHLLSSSYEYDTTLLETVLQIIQQRFSPLQACTYANDSLTLFNNNVVAILRSHHKSSSYPLKGVIETLLKKSDIPENPIIVVERVLGDSLCIDISRFISDYFALALLKDFRFTPLLEMVNDITYRDDLNFDEKCANLDQLLSEIDRSTILFFHLEDLISTHKILSRPPDSPIPKCVIMFALYDSPHLLREVYDTIVETHIIPHIINIERQKVKRCNLRKLSIEKILAFYNSAIISIQAALLQSSNENEPQILNEYLVKFSKAIDFVPGTTLYQYLKDHFPEDKKSIPIFYLINIMNLIVELWRALTNIPLSYAHITIGQKSFFEYDPRGTEIENDFGSIW